MDLISVYKTESKPFEDTRTSYTPVESSDHVAFNVSGYDTFYGKLSFAHVHHPSLRNWLQDAFS